MSATFSLTTDLISVRDRGYVTAIITAIAYFAAALFPGDWQIEPFSQVMLLIMVPDVMVLGLVVGIATVDRIAPCADRWRNLWAKKYQQRTPAMVLVVVNHMLTVRTAL